MNKVQMIELLKLRGILDLEGRSIGQAIKESGGVPTSKELAIANAKALLYFISELDKTKKELEYANKVIDSQVKKIDRLEETCEFLNYLEEVGVSNWEGYREALNLMVENKN